MKALPYLIIVAVSMLQFGLAQAQTDEELGLHSEGGPWKFYAAQEKNDSLKNVLLIGNSVMNGYRQLVIDSLKQIANVDCWLTPKHLKSEHLFADLQHVVSSNKYDVIQFNIGLHGWPKGRIKDDEYVPLLEKYVQTLIENAKGAKLIWASITPVTEQDKAELNKEINPTITQRNEWAAGVMKKYNISINDLYGLVADKLHLAKLDRFHWKSQGYQLMANQSLKNIVRELNKIISVTTIDDCNVIWDSPSKNSLGSMPAGNGDIGINLWVEENGDLLFYLSKTDAWSENARLLKLGKVRLSLSPNPFKTGEPFTQELILKDGVIHIEAGEGEDKVDIDVWVDANDPVVELDVKSQKQISASVATEPWRLEQREIADEVEIHSAYGLKSFIVEKDTILENDKENVIWAHRNERSIWESNLTMQGLEGYIKKGKDPLLFSTFGGLIHSDKLQKTTPAKLESEEAVSQFSVSVFALTAQTKSIDKWEKEIGDIAGKVLAESRESRLDAHTGWWQSFWNRSHIFVSTQNKDEKEKVAKISKHYNLQRYMNACSGRGNSPIKFNGSIFTVDTKNLENRFAGFDGDYRQWGGPYWWQNTRLPYWTMLEAGDFDLMQALFKMYREALPIRKFATKTYYGHKGAFYIETMRHWGTFAESNYGWDRTDLPLGLTQNRYIRYYWQSGLEFSLMALDYYAFTKDDKALHETILPIATEIINFYDLHWARDKDGKILFDPAMALETYNTAVNPLPEIVGINKVCSELLKLPKSTVSNSQREQYKRLIKELPEIPTREVNGEKLLAPAYEYSGKQNVENPELYAVFPYRRFAVGKDDLELGIKTFKSAGIQRKQRLAATCYKSSLFRINKRSRRINGSKF